MQLTDDVVARKEASIPDNERLRQELKKLAAERDAAKRAAPIEAERARLQEEDDRIGPDPPLSELDYLLLVCCAPIWGASATDVIAFAKKRNFDLGCSNRTVYNRLQALERRGLLEAELLPGRRGGERTQYVAVGDAPKFIRQWLQTPVGLPSFDRQLLVRLHAGRSSRPGRITGGLLPLRHLLDDHLQRLELDAREMHLRDAGSASLSTEEMSRDLQRTLTLAYLDWFRRTVKKLEPNIDRGFRQ